MPMFRSFSPPFSSGRRRILLAGAGLGLLATHPAAAALLAATAAERSIRFDLLRSGVVIGSHAVDVSGDADRLEVETRISVDVAPLGIALFTYRHHGRERYVGERLIAYDSETDDDDSRFFVHGKAEAADFAVQTKKGKAVLPGDTLVGSYWTPAVLARPMLLDPQRGRLKPQTIENRERTSITVGDQTVAATRYRISGIMTGSVVYDDAGRWLGATLVKKGSEIVYRLKA